MAEHGGAVDILWWTSVVLSVGGILLILLAFWRGWRKPEEAQGKKTLLFAMGVVPLGFMFFADQTLFHSMQEVSFCNSCHVMEPFVNALQKSGEKTLAAMHVQHGWIRENACYTCHTDYDMLGGVKAKVRGLRHLYAYYIKKSSEPPKLYNPMLNGNCLACHSQAMTF
ncbi:MAG TPA: NapC/NirT family cytochrome c, partial [candidate division Zixibacteria bacterium]|nr:NapC/NirT family cytochrome c [candidate division Zixibacteria bacterium]